MTAFAAASLVPLGLWATGLIWGAAGFAAAVVWLTGLIALADRIRPAPAPDAPEGAEFPGADRLLAGLALGALALWPLAVLAVAGGGGQTAAARVLAFLGAGLFLGQVANPAAHELIHRPGRGLRRLGAAVYVAQGFGHHASAHPLVHHVWVATPRDPNSAPMGMGFWTFLPRAWAGSFRAGFAAESARRNRRRARGRRPGLHPYAVYGAGWLAWLVAAWALAGPAGVAVAVALGAHASGQLLLSDYVQHYGLRRAVDARGRAEPVAARHSWNAAPRMSAATMLNAPRHSDHHAHPARPYPALRLDPPDRMPTLPRSLPVMAALALVPPLWRRVMDRRAARWAPGPRPGRGAFAAPPSLAD